MGVKEKDKISVYPCINVKSSYCQKSMEYLDESPDYSDKHRSTSNKFLNGASGSMNIDIVCSLNHIKKYISNFSMKLVRKNDGFLDLIESEMIIL